MDVLVYVARVAVLVEGFGGRPMYNRNVPTSSSVKTEVAADVFVRCGGDAPRDGHERRTYLYCWTRRRAYDVALH